MDRRILLKATGGGLGLFWLAPLGCRTAPREAEAGELGLDLHSAGERHLVFDADGVEYELDPHGHRIVSLDDAGRAESAFGALGSGAGELNYPTAAALGPDGRLYVVERGNARVQVFDAGGRRVAEIGEDMHLPSDVAIDAAGNVYVADTLNHEVDVFASDGRPLRVIGSLDEEGDGAGLNGPRAVAISPAGELHVADGGHGRVQVYALDGTHRFSYGSFGDGAGEMHAPSSIVFDGRGRACVADPALGFIHVFGPGGTFEGRFRAVDERGEPVTPQRLAMAPGNEIYVWTGGHGSPVSN